METTKNSMQSIKAKLGSTINLVGIAFVITLFGAVLTMGFTNAFAETVDEYAEALNRVQHFEEALATSKVNLCQVEKGLASTKLRDHYAGQLELTTQDVDRLVAKTRWTCDF